MNSELLIESKSQEFAEHLSCLSYKKTKEKEEKDLTDSVFINETL